MLVTVAMPSLELACELLGAQLFSPQMSCHKGGSQKTQKEGNSFAISGGENSAHNISLCLGWPPLWSYVSSSLPIASCSTGVWHASGPQSIMAESVMAKSVKHLLLQRLGILAQPRTSWVALGRGLT